MDPMEFEVMAAKAGAGISDGVHDDTLLQSLRTFTTTLFSQSLTEILLDDAVPGGGGGSASASRTTKPGTPIIRNVTRSGHGGLHRRSTSGGAADDTEKPPSVQASPSRVGSLIDDSCELLPPGEALAPPGSSGRGVAGGGRPLRGVFSPRRAPPSSPRHPGVDAARNGLLNVIPGALFLSSLSQKATDFLNTLDANFDQIFNAESDTEGGDGEGGASSATSPSPSRSSSCGPRQRQADGGSADAGAGSKAPPSAACGGASGTASGASSSQKPARKGPGLRVAKSAADGWEWGEEEEAVAYQQAPSSEKRQRRPPPPMHAPLTSPSGQTLATSPTRLFPMSAKAEVRKHRSVQQQLQSHSPPAAIRADSASPVVTAALAPSASKQQSGSAGPSPRSCGSASSGSQSSPALAVSGGKSPRGMRAEVERLRKERQRLALELQRASRKCADLAEENNRLRGAELDPVMNDAVRRQLEALLTEKARLVEENARLARENESLHWLLANTTEHSEAVGPDPGEEAEGSAEGGGAGEPVAPANLEEAAGGRPPIKHVAPNTSGLLDEVAEVDSYYSRLVPRPHDLDSSPFQPEQVCEASPAAQEEQQQGRRTSGESSGSSSGTAAANYEALVSSMAAVAVGTSSGGCSSQAGSPARGMILAVDAECEVSPVAPSKHQLAAAAAAAAGKPDVGSAAAADVAAVQDVA